MSNPSISISISLSPPLSLSMRATVHNFAKCRRELQSQQHLRTATLQHVDLFKAGPAGEVQVYWVAAFWYNTQCSYMLRYGYETVSLLTFDGQPFRAQFLNAGASFAAFVGRQGQLHIAASDAGEGYRRLFWQAINPATGGTISFYSNNPPYFWYGDSQLPMQDPTCSRFIGMPDAHTIVILDTMTYEQVASCSLAHLNGSQDGLRLRSLTWSPCGSMLAVELYCFSSQHQASVMSEAMDECFQEVQFFSSRTGALLQSLQLAGLRTWVKWSSRTSRLAVYCHGDRDTAVDLTFVNHPLNPLQQSELGESATKGTLRVLAPMTATCFKPVRLPATSSEAAWDSFRWCTGGELLMTKQPLHLLLIWDACNMDYLCRMDAQLSDLQWAWEYPSSSREMALVAYHVPRKSLLSLRKRWGQWHPKRTFYQAANWAGGCIPPDGNDLITLRRELHGSSCVHHHNLKTHWGKDVVLAYSYEPLLQQELRPENDRLPGRATIAWAPLPSAWRHVYAYVHQHCDTSSQRHGTDQSLVLVNAATRTVLRHWTTVDLCNRATIEDSARVPDRLYIEHLKWAPNCSQLAVFCNHGWTFMLTFALPPVHFES